jgi:hypothetical protein
MDFSGQNLQNHNFAGQNLVGAIFTGANLQGAIFDGADLTNANFTTPGHTTNLSGASFVGANLTNADFEGVNLQGANFDPPNAKGPIAVSSLTPQTDKQRPGASSTSQSAAPPAKGASSTVLNSNGDAGPAGSATTWQNAQWQHSQVSGAAGKPGHSWNGHPHAGAFDRYTVPANVTGTAALTNKPLPTPPAGGPPVNKSGFTRYVISGTSNAPLGKGTPEPQWFSQASAAGNTPHPRWLTQGSAANVSQPVQQNVVATGAAGTKGIAPSPTPTPQQVTAAIKQATPPPALQQISAAVKGTTTPLWLSQGSAAGQVKGVQPGTQQNSSQQNGSQQTATPAPTPILKK